MKTYPPRLRAVGRSSETSDTSTLVNSSQTDMRGFVSYTKLQIGAGGGSSTHMSAFGGLRLLIERKLCGQLRLTYSTLLAPKREKVFSQLYFSSLLQSEHDIRWWWRCRDKCCVFLYRKIGNRGTIGHHLASAFKSMSKKIIPFVDQCWNESNRISSQGLEHWVIFSDLS